MTGWPSTQWTKQGLTPELGTAHWRKTSVQTGQYLSVLRSCKRRKNISTNVGFYLPRISSENWLALSNGSTGKYNNDDRWKMDISSHQDRVAKICDKLQSSANPTWNWQTKSTTIQFLWQCYSLYSLFDLLIQFIAGYSCIRNNILNVPARPTSVEKNKN